MIAIGQKSPKIPRNGDVKLDVFCLAPYNDKKSGVWGIEGMHCLKAVQIFPVLYLVSLLSLSSHAMDNQLFIRQKQSNKDKEIAQWKQERDYLLCVQAEKAADKKETKGASLSLVAFYVSRISLDFGTVTED